LAKSSGRNLGRAASVGLRVTAIAWLTGLWLMVSAVGAAEPSLTPRTIDPWELAQRVWAGFAQLEDSVSLFLKTERIGERMLPTQTIELKVRQDPFSVYLRWLEPPFQGREVIYQKGRFEDKVVANLGDLFGFEGIFAFVPTAPEVMRGNRHPITEAGIGHIIERLYEQFHQAHSQNSLRARYLGAEPYLGRPTFKIMRVLEDGGFRYWNIDTELLLPIRVITYDCRHQLQETYTFKDLRVNVGLTDDDFDPQLLW